MRVASLLQPVCGRINPHLSLTLDLGRWSAAVLVLLFHIRENVPAASALGPAPGALDVALHVVGSCGQQAVYWFFVISGFLVGGGALADVGRGRYALGRFALHRVSRVYAVLVPALALGLCLDLARIGLHGLDPAAGGETPEAYGLATLVGNLLLVQTIFVPPAGSNIPLWSLANEGWYYVLFAAALAVPTGGSLRGRIGGALVFLGVLAVIGRANYHVIALFPLWLIGLAARFAPRPLMRSTGLAWAIVLAVTFAYPYTLPTLRSLNYVLVALAFANLLVTAMHSAHLPDPRAARRHAVLAGFSFSLYCTHAPLLHLLLSLLTGTSDPRVAAASVTPGLALALAGIAAACLAVAYGFSRLTEENTVALRTLLVSLGRPRPPRVA